jgi:hypothetical protein
VRRLLVFLVVLVLLVLVADRGAAVVAGRALGEQIRASQNLDRAPDVSFAGFPFLTQAVGGTYRAVDARFSEVHGAQGVSVQDLDVTLHGVHVPLAAVISGDLQEVTVDSTEADGTVTFAGLNAAANRRLPTGAGGLRMSADGPDTVAFTGGYPTPLGTLNLAGKIKIEAVDGTVKLSVQPDSLKEVPASIRDDIANLVQRAVVMPPLPLGLRIDSVQVEPAGINLKASGKSLSFRP